jgi:FKBP-type peptidyl-prolyl cis-trans isomerase
MMRFGLVVAALLSVSTVAAVAADSALSPQANAAFIAAYGAKKGVYRRSSGLEYRIIHNGYGKSPKSTDTVDVYYKGNLINGKVFDATEPGFPAEFPVNGVIPGWTEALQLMREGDEWELVIPGNLAYGNRGSGDAIPPNQTLVFDVTLVKVIPPKKKDDEDSGAAQ